MKKYIVKLSDGREVKIISTNWYEAKKLAWRSFGIKNIVSVRWLKDERVC
jgi:hypothetical protein